MPIWITELARWLGITSDSKRPNVGALLILGGVVLLAMGYTPDDVTSFAGKLEGMGVKLIEFAGKMDNLFGLALAGLGYSMTRGKNGTDFSAPEMAEIRAGLAALKVRRELAAAKPELEVD